MKEHPILFKPEMVRAILEGRKTQTRRLVAIPTHAWLLGQDARSARFGSSIPQDDPCPIEIRFPYGAGDRLWVKETWRPRPIYAGSRMLIVAFAVTYSNGDECYFPGERIPSDWRTPRAAARGNVSPLLMPRWASRLQLEVVRTRVERLQAITAKDIMAEGAVARRYEDQFGQQPVSAFDGKAYLDLLSLWAEGWDRINGKRAPWASNPWVRVIEFRRLP